MHLSFFSLVDQLFKKVVLLILVASISIIRKARLQPDQQVKKLPHNKSIPPWLYISDFFMWFVLNRVPHLVRGFGEEGVTEVIWGLRGIRVAESNL